MDGHSMATRFNQMIEIQYTNIDPKNLVFFCGAFPGCETDVHRIELFVQPDSHPPTRLPRPTATICVLPCLFLCSRLKSLESLPFDYLLLTLKTVFQALVPSRGNCFSQNFAAYHKEEHPLPTPIHLGPSLSIGDLVRRLVLFPFRSRNLKCRLVLSELSLIWPPGSPFLFSQPISRV